MIFSFNIRFLIFIWASGRAFRLKHIRFAHTRLQSLTRFTTLRNIYGGVIQDDREVFALPSSRIINFSLSLKMCKDKVGLKYPFINLYQKSLNIRARKRTRTFNNFYYRTPNVYFFPALLFCTSRKKRKKYILGLLNRVYNRVYLMLSRLFDLLFGSGGRYHLILRTHQIFRPCHQFRR